MRSKWGSVAAQAILLTAFLASAPVLAEEPLRTAEEARESMHVMAENLEEAGAWNPVMAQRAARLQKSLDDLTPLQVEMLADALAAAPGTLDNVDRFNAAMAARRMQVVADGATVDPISEPPPGVSPLAEPIFSEVCGDTRTDAATVSDQLAMWESLAATAAAAQATCDGADDASVADACEVAGMANDAALMARFAYENSRFCNADIDSAILDATLATVSEGSGGLTLEEHDNAVQSLIQAESQLIREQLDFVLETLGNHDDAVQNLIQAESQLLREQLDLVLTNQTTILANQETLLETQQGMAEAIAELRQLLVTPPGRRTGWNGHDTPANGNGNGN